MRIGVIADTHDRLPALSELVRRLVDGGASVIMHAGDYCSPFALAVITEASVPLLGVFGRNDGDHEGLLATAAQGALGGELFESPHSFEVAGHRILLVHDLADAAERSVEQHQFVFFGATHQAEVRTRGDSLLLNPGEGCGWLSGKCTAALLDLETREVETISL